jgi:hypothetical protein
VSLAFSKIKNSGILGLDDQLDFGKHIGYTVLEVIKDRPDYIDCLIKEGKKFYPSVHEELERIRKEAILKDTKKFLKRTYDWDNFSDQDDYWDDVPF